MSASAEVERTPKTLPAPADEHPLANEPDYVIWNHIGSESVFFYPLGSVQEHLVTEHGIPSVDMHWRVEGYYDHAADHIRQREVRLGAIGDLVAVTHAHWVAA